MTPPTPDAVDERIPQLVGVAALARRLGVGEPTLRKWAREGVIPSFRIGKLVTFDVDDIARWLATKKAAK